VDRAKEAPGRRIAQRPRLHRLDASRIPEDRIGEIGAEFENVLPCEHHDGSLPLFELQCRNRTTKFRNDLARRPGICFTSATIPNFYLKLKLNSEFYIPTR
jgi:hypothetical protein